MKRLAAALDRAHKTRSRVAKEAALADSFREIAAEGDEALQTAARLAAANIDAFGTRPLKVGWSILLEAAAAALGREPSKLAALAVERGDLGDAIGDAMEEEGRAGDRAGILLSEIPAFLLALGDTETRAEKVERLHALFARATPLEARYWTKALLGEHRVGLLAGSVDAAIARAFDVDRDEIRRASALVADRGQLAVLAHRGRLAEARLRIGSPIAFMLATPIETIARQPEFSSFVAEDKLDGIRAQLHKCGDEVWIFARGQNNVTRAFPEIAEALRGASVDCILDGELLAVFDDGRPRPFFALQNRLNRLAPDEALVHDVPVTFFAFDILACGGDELLAVPWDVRRKALEAWSTATPRGPRIVVLPFRSLSGAAPEIDTAFDAARSRGHEGVVLKRRDSVYEAGRRGQAWIKVKRAFATLDVVITAAETGHGKRAGVLSDYTFGVWGDVSLLNVGKAYSGLTDTEIAEMSRHLEAITVEQNGHRRVVRPEVVIEVAFDGIQRSSRHASGFALRFPRIVRIRRDKRPEDADNVLAVTRLYEAQVSSGHREEPKPARPRAWRGGVRTKSDPQLELFATTPLETVIFVPLSEKSRPKKVR